MPTGGAHRRSKSKSTTGGKKRRSRSKSVKGKRRRSRKWESLRSSSKWKNIVLLVIFIRLL